MSMRRNVWLAVWLAAPVVALAAVGPAFASAQIVYRHGRDLWAMNDNG